MGNSCWKQERGFTFLEIMVAVVILGLLTALAVPNLNQALENYKLNSAARQFVAQVRYVHSRAINGESTEIKLYYVGDRYYIRKGRVAEETVILPPGIRFENSLSREISFDLQGDLSGGANTIYLKNSRNRRVEITITPVTGRVKIK